MTDFETTSLLYAKFQTIGVIGAAIVGLITVIVGIAAVVIARGQLKQLVQQVKDGQENVSALTEQVKTAVEANKISRLESLLTLEGAISRQRLILSEAGIKLKRLIDGKKAGNEVEDFEIEAAKLHFEDSTEMYLNALDRLCSCFLNGILLEDELRADYRDLINSAVKKDFPEKMGTGTNHRNIVAVYQKWAAS